MIAYELEQLTLYHGDNFDNDIMQTNAQISIAISLKRIADSLDNQSKLTKVSEESLQTKINFDDFMKRCDDALDKKLKDREEKYYASRNDLK